MSNMVLRDASAYPRKTQKMWQFWCFHLSSIIVTPSFEDQILDCHPISPGRKKQLRCCWCHFYTYINFTQVWYNCHIWDLVLFPWKKIRRESILFDIPWNHGHFTRRLILNSYYEWYCCLEKSSLSNASFPSSRKSDVKDLSHQIH